MKAKKKGASPKKVRRKTRKATSAGVSMRRKAGARTVRRRKAASRNSPWVIGVAGILAVGAVIWVVSRGGSAPPHAGQAPETPSQGFRLSGALQQAYEKASRLPSEDRIDWWSGWLAANPNAVDDLASLGTGPETRDTAPYIPRHFDCTTYVETVIALSRSDRPEEFFQRLIEVRYRDATPAYLSRNHFPEADWIPNNIKAGILTDITAAVARDAGITLASAQKEIDRGKWLGQQARKSAAIARAIAIGRRVASDYQSVWATPETVSVAYISTDDLLRAIEKVPDGTVINFIRPNSPKRPVLVTHQGVVVKERGKVMLRHSSVVGRAILRHATVSGLIKTVDLAEYLRKNREFVGVTLQRVAIR